MKKKLCLTLVSGLICLLVTSCSTLRVNVYENKVQNVKSLALFSTIIGKVDQPLFPLVDAALFNQKPNTIAGQISNMEIPWADRCRESLAKCITENFHCQVLYGDSLHNLQGNSFLHSKYNLPENIKTGNEHFPSMILAKGDFNPFPFEKGNVVSFFNEFTGYQNTIKDIASTFNTDIVAFSFTKLVIPGVAPFGVAGYLRLDTYLWLFDRDGNLVSDSHSWSKPVSISGDDLSDYSNQYLEFRVIIDPMINKVAEELKLKIKSK